MKLHFKKTGTGKPLFILHGLFGMSDNWMTLSKVFAENGFACYAVDLRNHGRSPHSEEFNYSLMAEDLLELLSDEKISTADIIGHSMGGKAAMFFSVAYPERAEKIVVVDIAPRYYPVLHDSVLSALQKINLENVTSRKEAEAQLSALLNNDETTIQFLLKNLYWKEETKFAWRFNLDSISKNIESVGEVLPVDKQFDKPALFIRGEKSNYVTVQDEPQIKKQFPEAEIKTIAAGHWVHSENPKEFMNVTLEFLKRD